MELMVERDLSSRWRNKESSCECLDKACHPCIEKSGLNYWTDTTTSLACPSTSGRAGTRRAPGRRRRGSNGRRGSRRRWRRGVCRAAFPATTASPLRAFGDRSPAAAKWARTVRARGVDSTGGPERPDVPRRRERTRRGPYRSSGNSSAIASSVNDGVVTDASVLSFTTTPLESPK